MILTSSGFISLFVGILIDETKPLQETLSIKSVARDEKTLEQIATLKCPVITQCQ